MTNSTLYAPCCVVEQTNRCGFSCFRPCCLLFFGGVLLFRVVSCGWTTRLCMIVHPPTSLCAAASSAGSSCAFLPYARQILLHGARKFVVDWSWLGLFAITYTHSTTLTSVCFVGVCDAGPWPCRCSAEDFWEGYKFFCYAYYSNSTAHELQFRETKLGMC